MPGLHHWFREGYGGTEDLAWLVDAETGALVDTNPAAGAFGPRALAGLTPTPGDLRGLRVEATLTGQDGAARDFEVTLTPLPPGERRLLLGLAHDITRRRQAEAALRAGPSLICQILIRPDGRGSMPFASDAIGDLYELSPDDVREDLSPLYPRLHPDDREAMISTTAASARTLSPWLLEYRVLLPSRGLRWVLGRGSPQRLADGSTLFTCSLTDVTERRQAQSDAEVEHGLSQAALDALPEHLCVLDEAGVVVAVNRAWRDFAEANGANLARGFLGSNYLEVCAHAAGPVSTDAERFAQGLREVMRGARAAFAFEYLSRSPREERWFLARAARFEHAGQVRALVSHADITERHRTDETLREEEELFSLFVRHSPMYAFVKEVTPTESRVVRASENFVDMIGVPGSKMAGRTMHELFPPELATKMTADDWAVASAGQPLVVEEVLSGRTYSTVKFPLPMRGRTLLAGYTRDITQQREAERSARLAVVGTLAAGAAHEINNPLAYVLGNVEWAVEQLRALRDEVAPARRALLDEALEVLVEAHGGAERIRDIVAGLRTFSRKDETPRAPTDVGQAMRAALQLTLAQRRARAETVTQVAPTPPVLANEHQLERVFINLLINAAQAIPEGAPTPGRITVAVGPGDDGTVVATVEDTGVGIGDEVRTHLFEPFFTTKPIGQGTGLGLSICHGIITAFGGRMEVTSVPGRGSTFRVVLPALPEAPRPSAPVGSAPRRALPVGRRVLVVDDDAPVATVIARTLEGGPEVVVLNDSRAALARLAAGEPFDLVICDLMLPGMSGQAFQEGLAAVRPELARSMIFVTGGAFTDSAEGFLRSTQNAHLVKPFEPEALRQLVAERLAE